MLALSQTQNHLRYPLTSILGSAGQGVRLVLDTLAWKTGSKCASR